MIYDILLTHLFRVSPLVDEPSWFLISTVAVEVTLTLTHASVECLVTEFKTGWLPSIMTSLVDYWNLELSSGSREKWLLGLVS